jgi:uncharacterized membrane protein (UPF0127 family)
MKKLVNKSKNNEAATVVVEASTFFERLVGLLAQDSLDDHCAMYFPNCNNIHTFFMRFNIDLVFVDKNFKVCAIHENLKPFRLKIDMAAFSAIEMSAGVAKAAGIEVGDQLDVVD